MDNYYSRNSKSYYKDVIYKPEPIEWDDCGYATTDVCDYDDVIKYRFSGNPNRNDHDWAVRELEMIKYPYIKEGMIYHALFINNTWRDVEAKSFKDYCTNYLGKAYYKVRDIIHASAIACDIIRLEFRLLPSSVSMCKLLQKVKDHFLTTALDPHADYENALKEIWWRFTQLNPQDQDVKHLRDIIDHRYSGILPERKKRQILVDKEIYEDLQKASIDNDTEIDKMILEYVEDRYGIKDHLTQEQQEIKEASWELDTKELVEEHDVIVSLKNTVSELVPDLPWVDIIKELCKCKDFIQDVGNRILFRQAMRERRASA